jgi:hypothetical protein
MIAVSPAIALLPMAALVTMCMFLRSKTIVMLDL